MCCCCPPAISALFCLWCQSGCSKGSVAGALTFFPPEPPLYSFEKRDIDGNVVIDEEDDDDSEAESHEQDERVNPNEPVDDETRNKRRGNDDDSDRKQKSKVNQSGGSKESKEKMKSPAQQLVEKNQQLRKRAKRRNQRDARDRELGITYNLMLDPRLAIPPYDERNIKCVKIPSWNGIHIAAIIYKCPSLTINEDNNGEDNNGLSLCTGVENATAGCGDFLDFSDPNQSGGSKSKKPESSPKSSPLKQSDKDDEDNKTADDNLDSEVSTPASGTSTTITGVADENNKKKIIPKTIIYSHGNATDIGAMFPLQAILAHSLDCNIVMYDYSGYGESGGIPLEENTYKDIEAVYYYILENYANNDPNNIILYGQSVGSGPCCNLASTGFIKNTQKKDNADGTKPPKYLSRVGGLILHSPFTSGMRVLTPSRLLACLDIYPNIDRIKKVRCPVMVIHGRLDEEVEIDHGIQLHNAVASQYQRDPWWVPDRGHNDITEGPGKLAEYVRRLRQYLQTL